MSRVVWDKVGERLYETGVDRAVLFPQETSGSYGTGAAWNGFSGFTESPSGAEPSPFYANNKKYLNIMSAEELGGTIEAFTYPPEFEACDGSAEVATGVTAKQQKRVPFGMTYRTLIGNDTTGTEYGYKIHLIYGAQAQPSEKAYQTVNESTEPIPLSWEISTTPVDMPAGFKATAGLDIDSTKVPAVKLAALEAILYGTDASEEEATEPRLPLPAEVIELVGVVQG